MRNPGRLQRQALTAAERAIEALGRGDPVSARMAISTALDKDQTGMYVGVADAVDLAAGMLEADEPVTEGAWSHLADAVGPGPLQALVEAVRH